MTKDEAVRHAFKRAKELNGAPLYMARDRAFEEELNAIGYVIVPTTLEAELAALRKVADKCWLDYLDMRTIGRDAVEMLREYRDSLRIPMSGPGVEGGT